MVEMTVIVPTVCRATLGRTVKSLLSQQWIPGDQIVLLSDGKNPRVEELASRLGSPFVYAACPNGPHGDWGHTPRNWLIHETDVCSGTHLVVLDDDDVWVDGALKIMRERVAIDPAIPHIFRMDGTRVKGVDRVLWDKPELYRGGVGTPMFVVPNDKARLAKYDTSYSGDFDFIYGTVERCGGCHWHEELTTILRPPTL